MSRRTRRRTASNTRQEAPMPCATFILLWAKPSSPNNNRPKHCTNSHATDRTCCSPSWRARTRRLQVPKGSPLPRTSPPSPSTWSGACMHAFDIAMTETTPPWLPSTPQSLLHRNQPTTRDTHRSVNFAAGAEPQGPGPAALLQLAALPNNRNEGRDIVVFVFHLAHLTTLPPTLRALLCHGGLRKVCEHGAPSMHACLLTDSTGALTADTMWARPSISHAMHHR